MQTMSLPQLSHERLARLEQYLIHDPANRHLLAEMIELYTQGGRFEAALAFLKLAREAHPDDARIALAAVRLAVAEGRLDDAERAVEPLLEGPAPLAAAVYWAAEICFQRRQYRAAIVRLAAHPEAVLADPQALLVRAYCWHHLGEPGAALDDVRACLRRHPEDAAALGFAALLELDFDRYPEAGRLAQQALERDPHNLPALLAAGMVRFIGQDLAGARAAFQAALSSKADSGRAWLGLAMVELAEGQGARALPALGRTVALMPGHIGSWLLRGWVQLASGDRDGAHASFLAALDVGRNFGETHGSLAVIHVLRGETLEAETSARRGLGLDVGCASARFALALLAGELRGAADFQQFSAELMRQRALTR